MDLTDYLTPAEVRMARQRYHVHQLLQKGLGVREIARLTKISSRTVINIKRYLGLNIHHQVSKPKSAQAKIPWQLG